MLINSYGIDITLIRRQGENVNLIGVINPLCENLVIAAAHIGVFNVDKRCHIILVTKGDPVGQVAKINQKVIGGLRNGCFISFISSNKRHDSRVASSIKSLTVD